MFCFFIIIVLNCVYVYCICTVVRNHQRMILITVRTVRDLDKTCNKQTHVGRGPLLVLGDAPLQVEGQVVAADQNPLAKLLLELPHVRLDAGEIQFLQDEGDVLKNSP